MRTSRGLPAPREAPDAASENVPQSRLRKAWACLAAALCLLTGICERQLSGDCLFRLACRQGCECGFSEGFLRVSDVDRGVCGFVGSTTYPLPGNLRAANRCRITPLATLMQGVLTTSLHTPAGDV
jgi:hypothetical protein